MTATPIHDELVDALYARPVWPGDRSPEDRWPDDDTTPAPAAEPTRPFSMPLTSGADAWAPTPGADERGEHDLDDAARAVVTLAREEALAAGRARYGTGHLLLGLLRGGDAVAELLGAAGASAEATRRSVERYEAVAAGGDDDTLTGSSEQGHSPAVAATLAAARDADTSARGTVGTAGLLAALLDAPVGAAAGVLAALDVPRAELVAAARTLAERPAPDAAARRWRDPSRLLGRRD